ncbi:MAG: hypothetical protein E5V96_12080, partial [Mesorhizobium sp.]
RRRPSNGPRQATVCCFRPSVARSPALPKGWKRGFQDLPSAVRGWRWRPAPSGSHWRSPARRQTLPRG